jgi:fibronectin-binding autotransporter adhesin
MNNQETNMKTFNLLSRNACLRLWLLLGVFCSVIVAQADTFHFWGLGGGTAARAWTNVNNWAEGAAATNWIANGANDVVIGDYITGLTTRQSENGGASCLIANINSITFTSDGWNTFQKLGNEKIVLGAGGITNGPPASGAYTFISSTPPTNSQFRTYFELSAHSRIVNNDTNAQMTFRHNANAFTAGTNSCIDLKTFTLTFEGPGTNSFASASVGSHAGGAIKGSGGVIKNGTGLTDLRATNTYTGPTLVNDGRLNVRTIHAGGGSFTVADNATLGVTVEAVGTTLRTSSLTLGNSATNTLVLSLGALGNPTVPVVAATNLTLNGTTYLTVTGTGLTPGPIKLIDYDTIAGSGTIVTNPLPTGIEGYLQFNGTAIELVVTKAPSLRWTGLSNAIPVGTWDISVTPNWLNTDTLLPATFANGQAVTFDDTGASKTVTLKTNVAPFSITMTNTLTYAFTNDGTSGYQVNGTARIIKDGTGTLVVGMTNSYTGFTYLKQGTIRMAVAQGLGLGSTVTNDATLDLNGFAQNIGLLYGGGLITNSTTTPVDFTTQAGGAVGGDFTGRIDEGAGQVTLRKSGGMLRLSGNSKYTGGTVFVTGGAQATRGIQLGANNVLGTGPVTWSINSILTPDSSAPRSVTNSLVLKDSAGFGSIGAGLLTCSGPVSLERPSADLDLAINSDVTFTGPITSAAMGIAAKTGPGALRFQNNTVSLNNLSSALKINDGTVIIDGATATVTLDGTQEVRLYSTVANGTASLSVINGGSLSINSPSQDLEIGYSGAAAGSTNILDIQGTVKVADRTTLGYGGARAILNLGSGGVLATTRINTNGQAITGATLTEINLDGGTIIAPADAGSSFMEGFTEVNIRSGGVIINGANTSSIHIRQDLLNGGGGGGLTWNGTNEVLATETMLQLDGNNTYTGTTLISVGSLGGIGTLAGPLVLASGTGLTPAGSASLSGGSLGTFTVNNDVTMNSGVHCSFELNTTNSVPSQTNDMLVVSGNLSISGASISVDNRGTNLVVGDYFKLFNKAAVGFTSVTLPALDPGLAWQNNLAADGSIQVVVATSTPPAFPPGAVTVLPDGNISLTVTGALNTAYTLWASENAAATPITTTWSNLGSGTITVSPFPIDDLNATNHPRRFYLFSTP